MWQWVVIGFAAYALFLLLILSMARAASAADRSERLVFRAWLDERPGRVFEHPVLRGERRQQQAA